MARFPLNPASPNPRIRIDQDATPAVYGDLQYMYDYIQSDTGIIGKYDLDASTSSIVPVTTIKGIVDIVNMDGVLMVPPGPSFVAPFAIYLQNPILNIANRDNLYMQITPYYAPFLGDDNVIPYVLPVGFTDGLQILIYNANPAVAGTDNWKGALYIYYEIKEKN